VKKWNSRVKASRWWYLAGFVGFGSLIAIVYVFLSKRPNKILSLLYLIGIIGPLVVYVVTRGKDNKLSDISFKLFIGQIIVFVMILFIMFFLLTVLLAPSLAGLGQ
jgi:hypothetical protein